VNLLCKKWRKFRRFSVTTPYRFALLLNGINIGEDEPILIKDLIGQNHSIVTDKHYIEKIHLLSSTENKEGYIKIKNHLEQSNMKIDYIVHS